MQLSAINYNFNNKNLNFEGVKQKTVAKVVQKNKTKFVKEDIVKYIKAGLTYKDLAKIYHCNLSKILETLHDFGLIKENEVNNNHNYNMNITKEQLHNLIMNKFNIPEIAKIFNCSETPIKDRLKKFGLMQKYKEIHNININTDINISKEELQELVAKGLRIKDIAKQFNCGNKAINRRLHEFGLMDEYKEVHNINTDINISKEELQELVTKGLKIKDMAKQFNCSKKTINRRLHELGLIDEYNEIHNIINININTSINISKEELQDLVLNGFKVSEIAQKYNCSNYTIKDRLYKFGLMDEYKEINDINTDVNISKKELQELVLRGFKISEITQKYNCSRETIRDRLKKFGLLLKYKEINKINIAKKELQELVIQGFKIKEIALKYNCSEPTISDRLYQFGLMNEYKKIQKTKKQNTPQSITNNSTTKNQAQEKEITKSQNTKKENNSTISSNKPKTGVKQVIENKTPQIINDKIQILNKQFKRDVDLLKQKGISIYTLAEVFGLPIIFTNPLNSLDKPNNNVKNTNNSNITEETNKPKVIIHSPQKMSLTPEAINTRKKENKIYSKILEQRGIIVTENKYGQLTISEYKQPPKNAFAKNKVSEKELLKNVIEITGNADFEKSDITELLYIKNIGGNAILWKSQIQNLGSLQTVGGNLELYGSKLDNLGLLTSVVGDLSFRDSNITDISNVKEIGGTVYLKNSKLKPQDFGHIKVKKFM